LPITNFTEEVKEASAKKKVKDTRKDLGQIQDFKSEATQAPAKSFGNNTYIYLTEKKQYALIKSKVDDNQYMVKVKIPLSVPPEYEEIMFDSEKDKFILEVEISIRVIVSEEQRFTLILRKSVNEKLKSIAEELGDMLALSKYRLTFFYRGEKVNLSDRFGDREIGASPDNQADEFLLCMKGGSDGPIVWKRFTHIDDPCR
jgi:hypothetical protein